jgi:hypothetical protein
LPIWQLAIQFIVQCSSVCCTALPCTSQCSAIPIKDIFEISEVLRICLKLDFLSIATYGGDAETRIVALSSPEEGCLSVCLSVCLLESFQQMLNLANPNPNYQL